MKVYVNYNFGEGWVAFIVILYDSCQFQLAATSINEICFMLDLRKQDDPDEIR